jgi:hypothetical protein
MKNVVVTYTSTLQSSSIDTVQNIFTVFLAVINSCDSRRASWWVRIVQLPQIGGKDRQAALSSGVLLEG